MCLSYRDNFHFRLWEAVSEISEYANFRHLEKNYDIWHS